MESQCCLDLQSRQREYKDFKSNYVLVYCLHYKCYFRITNADIQAFRIINPKGQQIVNVAVTLIHQVDSAIGKYIKVLQDNFAKNGGLREKMTKIRKETRAGGE